MNMYDCPKFDRCSAPICPLDKDWQQRIHLQGERACFYLTEYSKPPARTILRGVLPREFYKQISEDVFPAIMSQGGYLCRQLKRSSKNPKRIGIKPGRPAA